MSTVVCHIWLMLSTMLSHTTCRCDSHMWPVVIYGKDRMRPGVIALTGNLSRVTCNWVSPTVLSIRCFFVDLPVISRFKTTTVMKRTLRQGVQSLPLVLTAHSTCSRIIVVFLAIVYGYGFSEPFSLMLKYHCLLCYILWFSISLIIPLLLSSCSIIWDRLSVMSVCIF